MTVSTNSANPSGTHLPYLAKLLQRVDGPILEMGSGFFSTPLLYWHTVMHSQTFRSYESKKAWADTMGAPVQFVQDWSQVNINEMRWSLVFIDHGQALLRKDHAIAVKDLTDYVVLHDTEYQHEPTYRYSEVWPHFKHRLDFTDILPHTTILSNTQDLNWLI
jgi:hypothetical protein